MRTIAYLGPEKTNTHVAARAKFGVSARYLHAPTVDDVFRLVERRQADYGVVPMENSLEGAVTHTLDRFIDFVDTPVTIHGEVETMIHHTLITMPSATLSKIELVYSHPQALAQCHRWLSQHVPQAVRQETNSTADAVWALVRDPRRAKRAAIGRAELATEHRLRAVPIPDERENKTRFAIIGLGHPKAGRPCFAKASQRPSLRSAQREGGWRNKTSILLALKDKPGALHDVLVPFKFHKINLTKIESRPSKRKAWEYLFFIDVDGHVDEPQMKKALRALQRSTTLLKILGSYPIAR